MADRVSIVLPTYNQADHVEAVLRGYSGVLERVPVAVELLPVVNGPSQDRSLEICRKLAQELPSVRVLALRERGWGRAVRHGLSQASGDLLCYTNCARTTPEDLGLFVVYGLMHPDCVIKANRRVREGLGRRLGSLLYNLECRALFDLPYWDINGTPKVFPRRLAGLLELQRDDDLIDLEFNVVCKTESYRVLEVPILSSRRAAGSSTTNWRSALRMYAGALQMSRERRGP
jgi:glycosyltransferase involved in cell wall biosynthesis